ncbi:MAG TPA: acyl-CoA dehydratase activase [Bacillota bacterium]|nr:acyl-CoA dehydratase activase [Bacillota bacterium]
MYAGLDLGSRSVKVALMEDGIILRLQKFDTMEFYRKYGSREGGRFKVALSGPGLIAEGTAVTATGYGRLAVNVTGARVIPEVKAHVLGAIHMTGLSDFTLLDLGGQDSKVALVRGGRIIDFLTNDKCAASTGRYLENMAAALGVSLAELGRHHASPAELASTCAVFGESELIEKVAEGYSVPALAAGVNHSIFKRIRPMLAKLSSGTVVFTGGVAYNQALRRIITEETGAEVVVPGNPEYAGAVGCCADAAGGSGKK